MKILTSTLLLCLIAHSNFSQENQGAINDNFNPVNGQFINPSNIVDAKPWLDINFVGASVYGRNNLAYFPNTKWLNFSSLENDPIFKTDLNTINAIADFDIKGPAFSLGIGQHSVSLFSGIRGIVNVNKMPGVLAKMASDGGISYSDTGTYDINNARLKSMVWGEIGFTYGKILVASGDNMLTGAITIKRLFGFQNAAFLVDDALVRVPNLDNANLLSTNGKYSYAEPGTDAGRGWGTNIGVTYKKMKENVNGYVPHSRASNCKSVDYRYKFGASLLDIGFINFNNNAYFGNFDENTDIDDVDSFDDLNTESQSNQQGTSFRAWLPAAASVQFDYNLNDYIYFNGTVVQKVPLPNTYGVERANLLALSARFETKYFGVGLPFTLQNYVNPQMGFALRIANFTIGSDNVLPIFFNHNELLSADIYFSLKHTFYKSPQCKDKKSRKSGSKKRKRRKGSKRNSTDCPAFN